MIVKMVTAHMLNIRFFTFVSLLLLQLFIGRWNTVAGETTHKWLDIFLGKDSIQRVLSFPLESKPTFNFQTSCGISDTGDLLYNNTGVSYGDNDFPTIILDLDEVEYINMSNHVPIIYIETDTPMEEIPNKSTPHKGHLRIESDNLLENVDKIPIEIFGRGNSTWDWPKKPYRIKTDYKVQILDKIPSKDYVLLANYADHTLLRNSLAFEAGRLLGMPYNMTSTPVEVYLNNKFRGSYILTEKMGINPEVVDIDKNNGILWEWGMLKPEKWSYTTPLYKLIMFVRDPDFDEIAIRQNTTPEALFDIWKRDIDQLEIAIKEGRPWDVIDINDFVNYILVQNLSCNYDFANPLSVHVYKKNLEDKFHFGPLWDFDKAFNYPEILPRHRYLMYKLGTYWPGEAIFSDLFKHSDFYPAFKKRWEEFMHDIFPQLLDFIDKEASRIKVSALKDGELFPERSNFENMSNISCEKFDENIEDLKQWLIDHVELISNDPSFMLIRNWDLRPENDGIKIYP